jgi:hypothetical protein
MNEPFLIAVTFNGQEQEYKARLERWGYTHLISVLIGETTVIFEPDEEGGYRVLNFNHAAEVPGELLQSLVKKIVKLID